MTGIAVRLFAAGILLSFASSGSFASDSYKLLRLAGTWVKWGEPAIGTRARVSYALATGRMDFPDAHNCRSITPIGDLLERSNVPDGLFLRELDAAFDAWSRAANITFVAVDEPAKADIVIGAQRKPRGKAYTNVKYGTQSAGNTRSIEKSLICLNPAIGWKVGFDGNIDIYDLRYTLIHEIGHAIGLDHPGPEGQMMSFRYNEDFRDLRAGDMFGAILLYGRQGAVATMGPAGSHIESVGDDAGKADPQLSLGGLETKETSR